MFRQQLSRLSNLSSPLIAGIMLIVMSSTALAKDPVPQGDFYFSGDRQVPIWFASDAIAILDPPTTESDGQPTAFAQEIVPVEGILQNSDAGVILQLQEGQDAAELLASADTVTRTNNRLAAVYRSSFGSNESLMILGGEMVVFAAPGVSKSQLDSAVLKPGGISFLEPLLQGKAYLYSCQSDPSCLADANRLNNLPEVKHAYPNWIQFRERRGKADAANNPNPPSQNSTTRFNITDPLFIDQWHLTNTGQGGGSPGEDANVQGAYDQDIGGTGAYPSGLFPVVIGVVDDGLELTHEDFNLFAGAHIDIRDGDSDPTPGAGDYHGTAVAGVAAADGFNGFGGSGVAPEATLAGIRLIGGGSTDAQEAVGLNHELTTPDFIDIYNNSWGPPDDGNLWSTGPLVETALANGVQTGRPFQPPSGAIYLWAGGNGLQNGDNSNYDAYANSRYTIAVAASTNSGIQSFYSEPGANLIVNAPSNGGSLGIVTTDISGAGGYDSTNYTSTFGGTSSATPLVAGVVALMFEAKVDLTWRDVQKVLATTAERNDPSDPDWVQNGAGHWINHKYGFGRVDATAAVNASSSWTNMGTEISALSSVLPATPIPDAGVGSAIVAIPFPDTISIQHVLVTIDSDHSYFGDLGIVLTSPAGTQSVLTAANGSTFGSQLQGGFTFTSMRHLDELSNGTWTLEFTDNFAADTGSVNAVTLEIFGEAPMVNAGTCNGLPVTVDLALGQFPTIGDDVIQGTNGMDTIVALSGNDTICSLDGDDIINTGPGDDWVDAGTGDDRVFGLAGDDTIFGDSGNDEIISGIGNDVVDGEDDNDILNGGPGNDTVSGGAGNDDLYGQGGDDQLFGGDGDDFVIGVDGADTLEGGAGDDVLNGGPDNDTVNGNEGNDTVFGLTGDDVVDGGLGDDQVFGQIGMDTVFGGGGNDELFGNQGDDVITAVSGMNTINGRRVTM